MTITTIIICAAFAVVGGSLMGWGQLLYDRRQLRRELQLLEIEEMEAEELRQVELQNARQEVRLRERELQRYDRE